MRRAPAPPPRPHTLVVDARTAGVRRHRAFEALVGAVYLTRMGRTARLMRMGAEAGVRGDRVLHFHYVNPAGQGDPQGARADGVARHESVAARRMTRIT